MNIRQTSQSIGYAVRGIQYVFKNEQNFRVQLLVSLGVIAFSAVLGVRKAEWIIILFLILAVLTLEVLNSALEKFLDVMKPRFHLQAGVVKDMLAGMVLLVSLGAGVIGCIIFYSYIITLLQSLS